MYPQKPDQVANRILNIYRVIYWNIRRCTQKHFPIWFLHVVVCKVRRAVKQTSQNSATGGMKNKTLCKFIFGQSERYRILLWYFIFNSLILSPHKIWLNQIKSCVYLHALLFKKHAEDGILEYNLAYANSSFFASFTSRVVIGKTVENFHRPLTLRLKEYLLLIDCYR